MNTPTTSQQPLRPGDQIQLTGTFLKNTGQHAGPEGLSVWTVVACPCAICKEGRWVATDELVDDDEGGQRPRHLAVANVFRRYSLDIRNCP